MSFLQRILAKYHELGDEALSMAFDRKQAHEKLSALQLKVTDHLFLLVHYPGNSAAQGWLRELRAWNGELRRYNKASKPRKSNYTKALLMKKLWEEPLGGDDERKEVAAQIADQKELPLMEPDEAELNKLVSKFADAVLDPTPGHRFLP